MLFRLLIPIAFFLLLTIPASGTKVQLYPLSNDTLIAAAGKLRTKDFDGALKLAKAAPNSSMRDFLAGIAAFKAGRMEEAAQYLSTASTNADILADYAIYHQGLALKELGRTDEALTSFLAIQKLYPESPIHRPTLMHIADILYSRNDFKAALASYQKFIETYPAGSDALTAQLRSALCREALGELQGAAKLLRTLWLTSPGSSVAQKADEELKRVKTAGAEIPPFSSEELYRRASTLFDLKKYTLALASLQALPHEGQSRDYQTRLDIKIGQTLYRLRRYREAEQLFLRLSNTDNTKSSLAEATYWLAKCRDKAARNEDALSTFLKVADRWPNSEQADDALLEAAYIKKSQKKWNEVFELLKRLLEHYPNSSLRQYAVWESGWSSFQAGDWKSAVEFFKKMSEGESNRDRALYWLARSYTASNDNSAAQTVYAMLEKEFPLSYYTFTSRKEQKPGIEDRPKDILELPHINSETIDSLPVPTNFERLRALITCGLIDEAKKELSQNRSRNGDINKTLGLARLYLEIADYNGAYNLVKREPQRLASKEGRLLIALQYPRPYSEIVARYAAECNIDQSLIYAIIRSESAFSPTAYSPAGAVGLMQLMPATAAQVAGEGVATMTTDRLYQPEQNITYGVRHMRDLIAHYNGNLVSVIASYNAGANAVNRWRKEFGNLPTVEFIENIPYGETREYVKQVLTTAEIYAKLYGMPFRGAAPSSNSP